MILCVYDIETYPNLFTAAFEDFKSDRKIIFEISEWKNQRFELLNFIKKVDYLMGYNNTSFDDIIINYIISKSNITVEEIYSLSQEIINSDYYGESDLIKRYKYPKGYKSIDLMKLHTSKALRVGLKEMAVSMNFPKIQDLPLPFNKKVSLEDVDLIKRYNFNDVSITKQFGILKADDLKLRVYIEEKFGLKCLSKDPVTTGVDLFAKLYHDQTGNWEFKDGRTPRSKIVLSDIILPLITFKSKTFKDFLKILKSKTITETKKALDYNIFYGGIKYVYGTGGLHSKDPSGIVKPKENEVYMDCDVASLYPSIWIQYGFCPAHLDKFIFIPLYKKIRDDRVAAKKTNKPLADTYKLCLNGSYGNTNNAYSWLQDPLVTMGITLNGQLMLTMLSERFSDNGFKVDSINTDGITTLVPKDKIDLYYEICKKWEKYTKLELEFTEYSAVYRLNVNSYIAVYKNGKTKEKGMLLQEPELGKGFDKPIIAKALWHYYVKGIPLEQYIRNHNNIYDFCMMQKMDKKFKTIWDGKEQQKTNRFYAAKGNKGRNLYKSESGKLMNVLKDSPVILLNDYIEYEDFQDYQINYQYYISAANKLKDLIEPKQYSLFN